MMKHKFNDEGSIKSTALTLSMRLNNNVFPLDPKNASSSLLGIIRKIYQWTWKHLLA